MMLVLRVLRFEKGFLSRASLLGNAGKMRRLLVVPAEAFPWRGEVTWLESWPPHVALRCRAPGRFGPTELASAGATGQMENRTRHRAYSPSRSVSRRSVTNM